MTDILRKRQDIEREVDGEASRLSVIVASKIYDAMEKEGIDKPELARRTCLSLDYLSGMLDGELPVTIKMMVRLATALGFKWNLVILNDFSAPAPKLKGSAR